MIILPNINRTEETITKIMNYKFRRDNKSVTSADSNWSLANNIEQLVLHINKDMEVNYFFQVCQCWQESFKLDSAADIHSSLTIKDGVSEIDGIDSYQILFENTMTFFHDI